MRYCPDCGTPHECEGQARSGPDPAVRIAEIEADRDKYIARISHRDHAAELDTAETIAETEAEASIVGDLAAAEIIAGQDGDGAEPETGEPIVVQVPDAAEPEPAAEEPPAVEGHAPRAEKRGGYWDAYR